MKSTTGKKYQGTRVTRRNAARKLVATAMAFVMLFYGLPAQALAYQVNGDEAVTPQAQDATETQMSGGGGSAGNVSDLRGAQGVSGVSLADSDADNLSDSPAFEQSQTVNGVTVTVQAEAGVFPQDAKLQVSPVSAEVEQKVSEAVEETRDTSREVAASYTFDITVLDAEGNEIQPAEGDHVHVSFATAEVAEELLTTEVYHVADLEEPQAESLEVFEDGEVAVVESDGFSTYKIIFTYSEKDGTGTYTMEDNVNEVTLDVIMNKLGIHADVFNVESSDSSIVTVVPPTVTQRAVLENGKTKRDQDGQVVLESCNPTLLTSLAKEQYPPTKGSDWTIRRGDSETGGTAILTLTLFDRPTYFITIETGNNKIGRDIILRHADGTAGTSFRISELIRVYVIGATDEQMKGYTYKYTVSNQVNNGTILCFDDTQVIAGNDGTAIGTGGAGKRYFAMERPENYQTASCSVHIKITSGRDTIAEKDFNLQFAQSNLQSDLNDVSRAIHPITKHVGDTIDVKSLLSKAGIVHPNCDFTFITIDNSMTLAPTETEGVFTAENPGAETVLVTVKKLGCYFHSARGTLYDGQEGTFYLDTYILPNAQAEVSEGGKELVLSDLNAYSTYTLENDATNEVIGIDTSMLTFKGLNENTEYTVLARRAKIPELTSPDTVYQMKSFKTSLTETNLDPNYQYRLSYNNSDKTPWLTPDASGTITFENLTPDTSYKLLKIDRSLPESSTEITPNYPANNAAYAYTRYQDNLSNTKEWRITSLDGETVYVDWTKGTGNNQILGANYTLEKNESYLLCSRPYITETTVQSGIRSGAATLRIKTYPGRMYKLVKGTATSDPACDGTLVGDGWYTSANGQSVITFSGLAGTGTKTYILSSKQPGQAASGTLGTTKVTTGNDVVGEQTGEAPVIIGTTANTVTVKAEPGMEYSIDGGETWKDATQMAIDNLPGGTYTLKEVVDGINFIDNAATQPKTITTSSPLTINRYNIVFDKNAEDATGEMERQIFDPGVARNLTANAFTRPGYAFDGWNTASDGSGVSYADQASVTRAESPGTTITLYAQWKQAYTITYNLDGGALAEGESNPTTYTEESESITLHNPSKTGYTFKGWSGTGLTGDTNLSVTIPKGSAGNRNYTANWLGEQEQPSVDDVQVTSGTTTLTVSPTKPGYEYVVTTSETTPTEDVWANTSASTYYKEEGTVDGSHEFTGLEAGTAYYVHVRKAGDDSNNPSPAADPISTGTKPAAPASPTVEAAGPNAITIKSAEEGVQYTITDGETTKTVTATDNGDLTVNGLQPATEYTVTAQIPASGNVPASDASAEAKVTTENASQDAPDASKIASTPDSQIPGVEDGTITIADYDPSKPMEYTDGSKDENDELVWLPVPAEGKITGLSNGDYEIRYKGDDSTNPSSSIPVTIDAKGNATAPENSPSVTPAAKSVTVNDPVAGQQYIVLPKGVAITEDAWKQAKTAAEGQASICFDDPALTPNTDYVVYTRNPGSVEDETDPSDAKSTDVKTLREAPDVSNACVIDYPNELIEVKPGFEIVATAPEGTEPSDWTEGTIEKDGKKYIQLTPGATYEVRQKADPSQGDAPSEPATFTVADRPNTPATPTVQSSGSDAVIVKDAKQGVEYTITDGATTKVVVAESDGDLTISGLTPGATCTVTAKVPATDKAPASLPSNQATVTLDKADFKETLSDNNKPKAVADITYDGNSHVLVAGPTTMPADFNKVQYSLDGVTWSDELPAGTDAGTYNVSVKYSGSNMYNDLVLTGQENTVDVVIDPKPLTDSDIMVVFAATTFIYSGKEQGPEITVKHGGTPLVKDVDYVISDDRKTNAGNYEAKVTGIGNYTDEKKGSYVISKYKASDTDTITVEFPNNDQVSFVYNGEVQKPQPESDIVVTLNKGTEAEMVLRYNTDYEIGYSNADSEDMGSYYVTVTLKGNYEGTTEKGYSITAKAVTNVIADEPLTFKYNGRPQGPQNIKVYSGDTLLGESDYALADSAATEVGEYELVARGAGNYSGIAKLEYKIVKGDNSTKPEAVGEGHVKAVSPTSIEVKPSDPNQEYMVLPVKYGEDGNPTAYTEEELTNLFNSAGENAKTGKGENEPLIFGKDGNGNDLTPGTDYVVVSRYKETDSYLPSPAAASEPVKTPMNTQEKPSAEGITTTPDSLEEGVDNGSITIPSDIIGGKNMEYRAKDEDGNSQWIPVLGTGTIEGLANGVYEIRYAGDSTTEPSDSILVTVKAAPGAPTGEIKAIATTDDNADDPDKASSITVNPTVVGQEYVVVPANATSEEIAAAWNGEGKKDGTGEAITFNNLKPGVAYKVLTRTPGTETAEPSLPASIPVGTAPLAPNPASDFIEPNYPEGSLKAVEGYEILKPKANPEDPDEWVTELSPFEPDTKYEVRKAEDKENGIPAGNSGEYVSPKRPDAPNTPSVTTKPAVSSEDTAGVVVNPAANGVVYTVKNKDGEVAFTAESADDGKFVVKNADGDVVKTIEPKDGAITIDGLKSNEKYTVEANCPASQSAFASQVSSVDVLTPKTAPSGLAVEKKVSETGSDGVISGVDTTMEYSIDGGNNWTKVTGSKIEGLGEGAVLVRYAEVPATETTPKQEASAPTTITMAKDAAKPVVTTDNDDQGKPVVTINPSMVDQIYMVVPVTRGSDGAIVPISEEDMAKALQKAVEGTGSPLTIGSDAITGEPLKPGVEYQVITRTKGEDPSGLVASDPIYTKPSAPNADEVVKADTGQESLTAEPGFEIKNPNAEPGDPGEWVEVIQPFEPGKTYEVRKKADTTVQPNIPHSDPTKFKAPDQAEKPDAVTGASATTDTITVKPSDPAQEYLVLPANDANGAPISYTPEQLAEAFKNAGENAKDGVGEDNPLEFRTDANGKPITSGTAYVVVNRVKATDDKPATDTTPATKGKTASEPAVSQPVNTQNEKPSDAPKVTTSTNDEDGTSSVTVNPASSNVEYVVVPKGTAAKDINWNNAKSPEDGQTTLTIATDDQGKPLTPGEGYEVVSRAKATPTGAPSDPVSTDIATTPKTPTVKPADAVSGSDTVGITIQPADDSLVYTVKDADGNTVLVVTPDPDNAGSFKLADKDGKTVEPGAVAPKDGVLTIDGLQPNKEYTVSAHKPASDTTPASEPAVASVKTSKAKLDPDALEGANKVSANSGLTYNGTAQPLVSAPKDVPEGYTMQYGVKNAEGKIVYSENIPTGTDAGDYEVYVKYAGDDQHEDPVLIDPIVVNIARKQITDSDVVLASDSFTYSGEPQGPEVTVKVDGTILTAGTHYDITGAMGTDKGAYTVKVTGTGNYTDEVVKPWSIHAYAAGEDDAVSVAFGEGDDKFTYDGQDHRPNPDNVVVKLDGKELIQGVDYDLVYPAEGASVDAGGYEVKVVLKGNYEGETAKDYRIVKANASKLTVEATPPEFTYSGQPQGPVVTVKYGDTVLAEDVDYAISNATAIDKGNYTLTVVAKGNFEGTVDKQYTIKPYNKGEGDKLAIAFGDDDADAFGYDGEDHRPAAEDVVVTLNGKELVLGEDYELTYTDAAGNNVGEAGKSVNAGSYAVNVKLIGNYAGDATAKGYKIEPQQLKAVFEGDEFPWTGEELGPKVTVTDQADKALDKSNYELTAATGTAVGDYVATVKGKGNYAGTFTHKYSIVKAEQSAPTEGPKTTASTDDESGSSTITVDPTNAGEEYSIDGGQTWVKPEVDPETGASKPVVFDSLTPGKEYEVVSRKAGDGTHEPSPASNPTKVTPDKAGQAAPSVAPSAKADSTTSVTVNPAAPGEEYSIDGGKTWVKPAEGEGSVTFDGLTPGKDYEVVSRKTGDDSHNPSPFSAATKVTTPKETQAAPENAPSATASTASDGTASITVKPAASDEEYSIDGGKTWVKPAEGADSVTFDGLTPGKDYEVVSRKAGTDTQEPSQASAPTKVTTDKAAIQLSDKNKPTAKDGLAYNGESQPLVNAPEELPEGCVKVQYSIDGGKTWSDDIPTAADAGTYPVTVKYVGDAQHADLVGDTVNATIGPRKVDENGGVAPLTGSDGNVLDKDGNSIGKADDGNYYPLDGNGDPDTSKAATEPAPSVMVVGTNPDDPDNVQGQISSVPDSSTLVNVESPVYDAAEHAPKAYDNAVLDAAGIPAEMKQGQDFTVQYYAPEDIDSTTGLPKAEAKPLNTTDPDADNYAFDAGEVVAVVTFQGNHTGTLVAPIKIEKREFHVITSSASKPFDGTPLTAPEPTVWIEGGKDVPEGAGLLAGQTVTVNVTGSQTATGSSENSYDVFFKGEGGSSDVSTQGALSAQGVANVLGVQAAYATQSDGLAEGSDEPNAKRKNYEEVSEAGTLKVTARDTSGDTAIAGADSSKHISVNPIPSDDDAKSDTPAAKGTMNAAYNGKPIPGPVIFDSNVKDANGNPKKLVEGTDYDVAYYDEDGNLVESPSDAGTYRMVVTFKGDYSGTYETKVTIDAAELTVTTPSATKVHDGKALTATEGATLDGLVGKETATLKVTGTQTSVGTSDNTYEIVWDGTAKEGNYTVASEDLGTLEVTAEAAKKTSTSSSSTTTRTTTQSSTPKTGDDLPWAPWAATAGLASFAILAAALRLRRREDGRRVKPRR